MSERKQFDFGKPVEGNLFVWKIVENLKRRIFKVENSPYSPLNEKFNTSMN